jgi:GDP-mannose 6-dehydrogenase
MTRVAVFGMGYVGCVTAACLGRDGHHVTGVDVNPDKVAELNGGDTPIAEPGLDEIVRTQVRAGRLRATTDPAEAVRATEVALVAVGTPSAEDGSVTSDAVVRVAASIGHALRGSDRPYTVVVRSTLLPGILEGQLAPRFEEEAGRATGGGRALVNNPEFLREGSAVRDYYHPPFVLVGAPAESDARPVLDLSAAVEGERIVTDTRTAALVKYACNAYHAVKVAFANEVGALARSFGADGHEVMRLLCRDTKLNVSAAYLRPGFAFGGSCLPKDLRALTRHADKEALRLGLLGSVLPSNEAQVRRALAMVRSAGVRRVGVVGLSFKAGTDDLRESPLVTLVETLLGWGYEIKVYDPGVAVSRLRGRNRAYIDEHLPHLAALLAAEPAELYAHAELLVLGTDVADSLGGLAGFAGTVLDLRRDLARPAPAATKRGG